MAKHKGATFTLAETWRETTSDRIRDTDPFVCSTVRSTPPVLDEHERKHACKRRLSKSIGQNKLQH